MTLSGPPPGFLLLLVALLLLVDPAAAFGAGSVPVGSEFKGFVWRHGDIAEALQFLPVSFLARRNVCFTALQRRQVYFGNWLRDFSQLLDAPCLSAVPEPVLRAIVSALAFLEFGFATDEFDVTRARLGVYAHVEHVDNPRGYPDDARIVDPRLRGPVDPRELAVDAATGMKNYVACAGRGWPTAAAYVREQLLQCIQLGRRGRRADMAAARSESFIHLGAALHTLEDFAAHSNFVELCLRELGEETVFPFVGEACRVEAPRRAWGGKPRMVAPLVTGTFGMLDIFHSLLGEADDMAILRSRGSLGSLEDKLVYGGMAFEHIFQLLKTAIKAVSTLAPAGDNDPLLQQLETVGQIFKRVSEEGDGQGGGITDPNFLWQLLEPIFHLHDRIAKWTSESSQATEEQPNQSNSQLWEYTVALVHRYLALMIEGSVKELRNAVRAAKDKVDSEAAKAHSAAVYEPGSTASDPSHADLSKDHFSHVLNPPAGLVATVTTNWAAQRVIRCWDDAALDAEVTVDEVLAILHHPAFALPKTPIQTYMFATVRDWWGTLPRREKEMLRGKLTRESAKTRGHENHALTMKDLEGRPRGFAKFPGSRPRVRAPQRRAWFPLAWLINEVMDDAGWAVTVVGQGIRHPRRLVGQLFGRAAGFVVSAMALLGALLRWVWRLVTAGL
ncbi:hypothetical protein P8C59_004915 [Phyllachora maydis]|uniref:Uncharacterized protein n=1 Tax=Phyllachora maydis TaxID=1825666 RepID=A0AAD9MCZ5_9PEZI|nr:hypothetical protein P8C59_004915 [Phyllachora maydis]